ncbi:MAG: hypothetical protein ABDH16_04645 [Thermodesulfovibrionaceae bacterium]
MRFRSIFYIEDGEIKEFNQRDSLKKYSFSFFYPNIGVISYKNLIFIRKSYPKTVKKHLKKIIEEEIKTIFPVQNNSYFYQIIEETDSKIDLNIWVYEIKIKDELLNKGCSYIIPEPLIFSFDKPTVMIYQTSDFYVFIFSMQNKLLNFLTAKRLSKENISLFCKGIKDLKSVKWIVYTKEPLGIHEFFDENIEIEQKVVPDYPLFLDFIKNIKLKDFSAKKFKLEKIEPYFLLRIFIYVILAVSLSFYMSNQAYEKKIREIDDKIKKLKSGIVESSESFIEIKINEKRQKNQDVLYILHSLSNLLPQGSIIKKISISDEKMDISISTPEPLIILNNLNFENCFKSIKLASPMNKEEGKFNIELKIGLDRCKFPEKS